MRRVFPIAASLILAMAFAGPAAAERPERSIYTSLWASTSYVSGLDPYAPGAYSRLTIRYSSWEFRRADGTTTLNFIDIFADGWTNTVSTVFNDPWEAGYFLELTPADPRLGGVSPSLADAWVDAGPLAFVCYQGPCPAMPVEISMSVSWVANGAPAATLYHEVDDIGAVSSLIYRGRAATASVDSAGLLNLPAIVTGSSISFQQQVYRAPTP